MKNFVYLVQSTFDRIGEYLHLRERPDTDAVFLTYDQEREGCIFFPNSTYMQGRNRILAEARKNGDYRYFIFMDDDVEFVRGGYDEFESLLLQLRPAIGVPVFNSTRNSVIGFGSALGWVYFPYLDWQIARDYDGQMNAYHRDLILDGLALPYWESFTDDWWMADIIPRAIARNFYPDGIVQFNRIAISNKIHRDYPRSDESRESAMQWMTSQFTDEDVVLIKMEFSFLKYLRRLILPTKPKYFRRSNPHGLITPLVRLLRMLSPARLVRLLGMLSLVRLPAMLAETRAYRPRENYRVNPQLVAERLHPDSPLYRHYRRHRAD